MAFNVGDLIDGHYRVEQRFAGGMGFVYISLDEVVGKRFAIKQLSELHADDPVLCERFRREASTWLLLDYHPHVVQAYSYLHRAEAPMLILEYVDGPSLDLLLRVEQKLAAAQIIAYARQFCQAMHHAHTRVIAGRGTGVLHRDIKPANILITRTNELKVTDFGLAKIEGDANITSEGQYVGTVAFSSPEQLRAAGEVTRASDVYSFGAVLYQMFGGQPPFRAANTAEVYYAIQELEPPPLTDLAPELNAGLARVVMQCLQKDPAQRFADFTELEFTLGGFENSVRDRRDRACPQCGFITRRRVTKCSVCGGTTETRRAKVAAPQLVATAAGGPVAREAPGAKATTWTCVCGTKVKSGAAACPKCGRARTGTKTVAPCAETALPLAAEREPPIPAAAPPNLDSPAADNLKQAWELESGKEYLVELRSGGSLRPWLLERTGYTLGRDASMKIRLEDPTVARYHLFLVRLPCGWLAMNPQPNSVFEVNGWETKQRVLRPADLIRVGATWLAFSGPAAAPATLPPIPGRWLERAGPKAQTIKSGGSSATEVQPQPAAVCWLEIAGGSRFASRGQPLRIGRSTLCDAQLNDESVAPIQALVVWREDGPHLVNLTGGLVKLVGGETVSDRRLQDGDLLQIGAAPMRVRLEGDPLAPAQVRARLDAAGPDRFAVTVLTGSQKGQTAVLPRDEPIVLGRHSDCDVMIATDPHVSRRHLELTAGASGVQIKDIGRRSGFFVNQVHYPGTAEVRLGDVLVVGKTSVLVHNELATDW